jgi:hypothetical protein
VRAQEFCAFLLTLTYIDVANPEITAVLPFWSYFSIEGDSPRAADFRDQRAVIFRQWLLGRIPNTNCVNVEHHRSDMLPD